MTDIVWGDPIAVNGVRPDWLKYGGPIQWRDERDKEWRTCAMKSLCWDSNIDHIMLPADHWAYLAIEKGFEPWAGGKCAPDDWDGGGALQRSGHITHQSDWSHRSAPSDIIGYRKKTPVAEDVPQWAWLKADSLIKQPDTLHRAREAFARYIAQHEEPPVDPLVQAFDEIHGYQIREGETWSQSIADRLRAALAKRGLEIREIG